MKHTFQKPHLLALTLLTGPVVISTPALADVKLPAFFTDHMVLQRDQPVPIWGWANPSEAVTVSFAGQKKSTIADAAGKWMIRLDKLRTNVNPQTLTVTGKNTLSVSDILVGEVWLCSGQSNMTYRLGYDQNAHKAEIAAAGDPGLRCFSVDFAAEPAPLDDLKPSSSQKWRLAEPDSAAYVFPAVGYYFGLELRKNLGPGVPVGLLHCSYPACAAEPFVSREALSKDPELKTLADKQITNMEAYPDNLKAFYRDIDQWETKYSAKDAGDTGEAKGWAKPDFDDSSWKTVTNPMRVSQIGMPAGGAVWLRKSIDVPASATGKWLNVRCDYSTDDYAVYFNGTRIDGGHDTPKFFRDARGFWVPGSLVHEGRSTIAIRMFTHTSDGGLSFRNGDLGISLGADPNTWKYAIEFANPALPVDAPKELPNPPYAIPQYTATYVYNAMIHPLMPFAVKGAIWYQGESNAGRAYQYRKLLPALMADWRTRWGQGDFPFYIVQLANFMAPAPQPTDTAWAELREAQLLTATHDKASGLAVTIDIGDKDNIHPLNKIDVGKRLGLIALAKTYKKTLEYSGPLYTSSKAEGGSVRVKFAHTDGGLIAKGGVSLTQFAIAGDDKKFVWADARIDGDAVVVSSAQVPHPVAVRYAFADNPDGCNLYNGAGLPASPFRTDAWPGVTINNH